MYVPKVLVDDQVILILIIEEIVILLFALLFPPMCESLSLVVLSHP